MKMIILIIILAIILIGGYYLATSRLDSGSVRDVSKKQEDTGKASVTISTEKGDIRLELYPSVAPKTVANFIKLAREGFYNGTKFHRVMPDFMIQGGDPLSKTDDPRVGTGGPGYKFENEINPRSIGVAESIISELESAGYKYDYNIKSMPVNVGVIAMANSGPNTNGSQFFIVTYSAQPHLNGKHTVFGKVADEGSLAVVRDTKLGDIIKSVTVSE